MTYTYGRTQTPIDALENAARQLQMRNQQIRFLKGQIGSLRQRLGAGKKRKTLMCKADMTEDSYASLLNLDYQRALLTNPDRYEKGHDRLMAATKESRAWDDSKRRKFRA